MLGSTAVVANDSPARPFGTMGGLLSISEEGKWVACWHVAGFGSLLLLLIVNNVDNSRFPKQLLKCFGSNPAKQPKEPLRRLALKLPAAEIANHLQSGYLVQQQEVYPWSRSAIAFRLMNLGSRNTERPRRDM
jgi:hypothetical protein